MKTLLTGYVSLKTALVVAALFTPLGRAAAQSAFNGFPFGLPATIECEQFDNGSNGSAYYDNSPGNAGGKYRGANDVDIYRCSDYGGAQGYCVGNTWPGEWLRYSITNSETASYQVKVVARLATITTSPTTFHVAIGSIYVTMTLPLVLNSTRKCSLQIRDTLPTLGFP